MKRARLTALQVPPIPLLRAHPRPATAPVPCLPRLLFRLVPPQYNLHPPYLPLRRAVRLRAPLGCRSEPPQARGLLCAHGLSGAQARGEVVEDGDARGELVAGGCGCAALVEEVDGEGGEGEGVEERGEVRGGEEGHWVVGCVGGSVGGREGRVR